METTLSLPGVSLLYTSIVGVGLIYSYFVVPETEGRSLEDIELHFADNTKKLTDWKIAKTVTTEPHSKANDDVENESAKAVFTISRTDGN